MEAVPYLAALSAVLGLGLAAYYYKLVEAAPAGNDRMVFLMTEIQKGARAFLKKEYQWVAGFAIVLAILLAIVVDPLAAPAYLLGAILSAGAGYAGMTVATMANARTTEAAKEGPAKALPVAFRGGAVMGFSVAGLGLLGLMLTYLVFVEWAAVADAFEVVTAYGLGASTIALFSRVGGGIYTKAADVGADLVGKVEAGIPEDDPRNPATIADNVGDNVGDVAGMGADLYESYYGSILATLALGAAAAFSFPAFASGDKATFAMLLAAAPLGLAGLGILCSVLGIFTVRAKENATFAQLLKGLHKGVYVASFLIILATFGLLYVLFGRSELAGQMLAEAGTSWWRLGLAIVAGLVAGNVIAFATEYYTSYEHAPTKKIAIQALTGPATVIIAGIAEGMKSTWASLLVTVTAIIAAFTLAGGDDNFLMGLYGVGIAAVGMLSTLGITLATDAYGPIADNAGGNAEMTSQPPFVRERTDMLDSLGNTTAATGKGFAIGSAALTALALFAAYVQVVQTQITTQSETFAVKQGIVEGAPYAVYEGHHKFALVDPAVKNDKGVSWVDGGMLVDRVQLSGTDFDDRVEVGDRFTLRALPRYGVEDAATPTVQAARRFVVESPEHNLELEIISSRNGTLGDIANFYDLSLTNPRVLGGVFVGVMLAFLFCALTMNAVGRAAYAMMRECRRQFGKMREGLRKGGMSEADVANPDNWPKKGLSVDGTHYPDYATCVSISTAGAQREMVIPAILAIVIPIAVGLVLNVPGVIGLLAGGLTSGFAVAVFMANAGGAWDNAKKLLESYGKTTAQDMVSGSGNSSKVPAEVKDAILARAKEMVAAGKPDALVYGKGSDDHKATVVGDTVGDPFKDTSGPSLNILIKLISIVSVVFAGLIVKFGPIVSEMIGLH